MSHWKVCSSGLPLLLLLRPLLGKSTVAVFAGRMAILHFAHQPYKVSRAAWRRRLIILDFRDLVKMQMSSGCIAKLTCAVVGMSLLNLERPPAEIRDVNPEESFGDADPIRLQEQSVVPAFIECFNGVEEYCSCVFSQVKVFYLFDDTLHLEGGVVLHANPALTVVNDVLVSRKTGVQPTKFAGEFPSRLYGSHFEYVRIKLDECFAEDKGKYKQKKYSRV
ncbi:hypothetical protein Trydic_g21146 [Trypoxylus dichotomus]